ncbi:hypothetical protein FVEN_g6755 [Fusarium venenatum]|nr:hypothetical protein FVEN_g6755 [Fusarium venenatum]
MLSLIVALSLLTAVDAFRFHYEEYVNGAEFFDKRCVKALTSNIDCDQDTRMVGQYRSMGWLGSNRTADAMCLTTCFDSLQRWNKTVTEECDKDLNRAFPPLLLEDEVKLANQVQQMWNATCIRDTKSGRYCFDVVEELRGRHNYGEEKPFKEPCHPCYGMVVKVMLNSSIEALDLWGLDDDYWRGQLELVHEKCGGPDKIEKDFEEQKVYNASHAREPELKEIKGTAAMINQMGGVWITVLTFGWSLFML